MNDQQKTHLRGLQEDLAWSYGTTKDWAAHSPIYRVLNDKLLETLSIVEYIQEHFDEDEGDDIANV